MAPMCLPGSVLNHLPLESIVFLNVEITDFGRDAASIPHGIPDADSLTVVTAANADNATADQVGVDDFWSQAGSQGNPSGAVDDVTAPAHADSETASAIAGDRVFGTLGGIVLSNSIAQALAERLALPAAPTGSGGAGGSSASQADNSAGGAAGTAAAATSGGAAGSTSGGGSTDAQTPLANTGVAAGSPLFLAASLGQGGPVQPAARPSLAPDFHAGTTPGAPVDLHASDQSRHNSTVGLQGLAGAQTLELSSLNRHNGAGTAVTRPDGAPLASLTHGGQAGLGLGIAAPPVGEAGPALAGLADQAAAHAADTRGALASAAQHGGQAAGDATLPAGSFTAAAANPLANLPALGGTTGSSDPQPSPSSPPLTHPNLLATHLTIASVHVHDPESFSDSDDATSSFTLHAEGDDATGHFILDESGNISSDWSENGNDDSDNWSFSETGNFTATFNYVGQSPTTTTVPIDVHEDSSDDDAPTGFDLDGYNQAQFYAPGSLTTYTINATGSETYQAQDQGTITDDQGDDFTFTVGDQGGDGFTEDDSGSDSPVSAGGFDTSDDFDDTDQGNETDTVAINGTLAGGVSINYSDTDTSGYTDSDQGDEDESAGGTDSGDDNFDDTVTGSDSPDLTITEPVSDSTTGFNGTLTYSDHATDSYSESDQGNVDDTDSGTDNFDDSDSGTDDTTVSVTGSVNDPVSGFSGTINYSDEESGGYHDHDSGPETDTDGAVSDTDNFDDGDNGNETISESVQGSINVPDGSFTGTVNFSDNASGHYGDSDTGSATDGSDGSETGNDNYDDTDSGSEHMQYGVQGTIADPGSGFAGSANYSDTADGSYNDSDQGPDTETAAGESDTDNFTDGDSGDETITQTVQGSVNAPDGSFTGTVSNSETTTSTYHDSDTGEATDGTDGSESGNDTFDEGDGGSDHNAVTVNGTLGDGSTVSFSDTVDDDYSDDDAGSDQEAADGTESGTDNFDDSDSGDETVAYQASGPLPGGSYTESAGLTDSYDDEDDGIESGAGGTDTVQETTTDGDQGNYNTGRHNLMTTTSPDLYDGTITASLDETTSSTDQYTDHLVDADTTVNGAVTSDNPAGSDTDAKGGNIDKSTATQDDSFTGGYEHSVTTLDKESGFHDHNHATAAGFTVSHDPWHIFNYTWNDAGAQPGPNGTTDNYTNLDTYQSGDSLDELKGPGSVVIGYVFNAGINDKWVATHNYSDGSSSGLTTVHLYIGNDVWNGTEYVDARSTTITNYAPNGTVVWQYSDSAADNQSAGDDTVGVGQPGFWESLIPIWGSGRAAIDDFQNGRYGWAAFNTVMAVSDVFLVKSLVTAAGKGFVKIGGKVVCYVSNAGCFIAGTLVDTESGQKPIELVQAGERVWSCDLTTGAWRLCSVLDTYATDYVGEVIEIQAAGSHISSTYHHPVWVVEGQNLAARPRPDHVAVAMEPLASVPGRWVDAGDLCVGDVVLLQPDRRAVIEAIAVRLVSATVYNFEVEGLHNYTVGADRVLVHNNALECLGNALKTVKPKNLVSPKPKGGTYLLRDAGTEQVMRTGRTKNLAVRRTQHARDPVLRDFEFEVVHRTDAYAEQRGLEEILHQTYQPPLDKISAIGMNNRNLDNYLLAGVRFLFGR